MDDFQGPIDRRRFLQLGAAGGALALGGRLGAFSKPAELTQRLRSAAAAAASRDGTLILGAASDFVDFDPYHNPDGNFPIYNQLYGSLYRDVNQSQEADAPAWLATGITLGPNSSYVDVALRPGVVFHDGTPFDAEAVVANLVKVNNEVTGRDLYGVWHAILKGWKVLDSEHIRIIFQDPIPDELLIAVLTDWYLVSPKLIAKGENAFLNQADGTGAFYLSEYRPGDVAIMKKSPTFWKKPLPYLDELQYQFFQDPTAMLNALEGGTIDLAIDIPNQNIDELSSRFDIYAAPQNYCFEVISCAKPGRPFERLAARQALQYLVPRERFVQEVLFGRGQPAYVHVTHDSIGWQPSFDTTYSYNPSIALEKFQKLDMLGKAPIQIVQITGIIPTIGALCELMAAEMTAIGLNTELIPVDLSEWVSRFYGEQAGDFDMMCSYMGRCNRYPTQPIGTNAGLFPVNNPCWPGGNPPAPYVSAYNELLHALTPADQRKWALALMGADLYYSWDIAVATWGAQYALPKDLVGFGDGRDDYIILDSARFS